MWKVSTWVTDEATLKDLGLNVLKVEDNIIQTALHSHRTSITDAAHNVLSKWQVKHETLKKAYRSLYTGLTRCGMNQWATKLQDLAGKSEATTIGLNSSEKGSR